MLIFELVEILLVLKMGGKIVMLRIKIIGAAGVYAVRVMAGIGRVRCVG